MVGGWLWLIFSDGYFSMKKGVWRYQFSWLFLIHNELSDNQKTFGFFCVLGWSERAQSTPLTQATSRSPPLLGLISNTAPIFIFSYKEASCSLPQNNLNNWFWKCYFCLTKYDLHIMKLVMLYLVLVSKHRKYWDFFNFLFSLVLKYSVSNYTNKISLVFLLLYSLTHVFMSFLIIRQNILYCAKHF